MRVLFIALIVLSALWILLMLFWALAAVGSGHNVPTSTFLVIAAYAILGALVVMGSLIGLKKIKR